MFCWLGLVMSKGSRTPETGRTESTGRRTSLVVSLDSVLHVDDEMVVEIDGFFGEPKGSPKIGLAVTSGFDDTPRE